MRSGAANLDACGRTFGVVRHQHAPCLSVAGHLAFRVTSVAPRRCTLAVVLAPQCQSRQFLTLGLGRHQGCLGSSAHRCLIEYATVHDGPWWSKSGKQFHLLPTLYDVRRAKTLGKAVQHITKQFAGRHSVWSSHSHLG